MFGGLLPPRSTALSWRAPAPGWGCCPPDPPLDSGGGSAHQTPRVYPPESDATHELKRAPSDKQREA